MLRWLEALEGLSKVTDLCQCELMRMDRILTGVTAGCISLPNSAACLSQATYLCRGSVQMVLRVAAVVSGLSIADGLANDLKGLLRADFLARRHSSEAAMSLGCERCELRTTSCQTLPSAFIPPKKGELSVFVSSVARHSGTTPLPSCHDLEPLPKARSSGLTMDPVRSCQETSPSNGRRQAVKVADRVRKSSSCPLFQPFQARSNGQMGCSRPRPLPRRRRWTQDT